MGKNDFYLSTYNAYYLVDNLRRKYPGKPIYLLGDDYGGTMAQYMIGKLPGAFDGIIVASCGNPTGKDVGMFLWAWLKKVCLYDGSKSNSTFRQRTAFLNSHFRPTLTKTHKYYIVTNRRSRLENSISQSWTCKSIYNYRYIHTLLEGR